MSFVTSYNSSICPKKISPEGSVASISKSPITLAIIGLVLDNKIDEAVKKTESITDIVILRHTIKALVGVSTIFNKTKQSEFLTTVALGTLRVKGLDMEALEIASKIPLILIKEKTMHQIMLLMTAPNTRHETVCPRFLDPLRPLVAKEASPVGITTDIRRVFDQLSFMSNSDVLEMMPNYYASIIMTGQTDQQRLIVIRLLCMAVFNKSPDASPGDLDGFLVHMSGPILKAFLMDYAPHVPVEWGPLMGPIIANKLDNLESERVFYDRLLRQAVDLNIKSDLKIYVDVFREDVFDCLGKGNEFSRMMGFRIVGGRGHATHLSVQPFGPDRVKIRLIDPNPQGTFSCVVSRESFGSDASKSFFERILSPIVDSLGNTYYENREGGQSGIRLIRESLETLLGCVEDSSVGDNQERMAAGYCVWQSIMQGMALSLQDISPDAVRHFELFVKRTVLAMLDTIANLVWKESILPGKSSGLFGAEFLGLYFKMPPDRSSRPSEAQPMFQILILTDPNVKKKSLTPPKSP
jgi:hypothetical protein